jgi:hypothetical protein
LIYFLRCARTGLVPETTRAARGMRPPFLYLLVRSPLFVSASRVLWYSLI